MSSSPYAPAARILSEIWTRHTNLKSLAYDKKGNPRCSKATYAQVCHVLGSKTLLDRILKQVRLEDIKNKGLLYVLLYELLLGPNQSIRGGGALKRKLLSKEKDLRRVLDTLRSQEGVSTLGDSVSFPRYVRVNTLLTTVEDVVKELQVQIPKIYKDEHVPNLLVLPPDSIASSESLQSLAKSGKVVLQDKSSCFSALCMVHGFQLSGDEDVGDYMDACAAPGNKTSHLVAAAAAAAADDQGGKVFALDRASSRIALLQKRMALLVPSKAAANVEVVHQDFLKTTPKEYKNVRGILLDPSCSGSGIYTSPDRQGDSHDKDDSRIESLANFQLVALKHAMSFPNVTRIVYSTCSVHKTENEQVVAKAIHDEKNKDTWEIVAPLCLQNWKRRGQVVEGLTETQARSMIRANQHDETNGFFVCCLQRRSSKKRKATAVETKPLQMQIPTYRGQFSTKREIWEMENNNKTKPDVPPEKVKQDEPNESPKPVSKKRLKKLAWKRRQAESKVNRLRKQKAQKASNEKKEE